MEQAPTAVFPILSVWALVFWIAIGALLAVSFVRARSHVRASRPEPLDDEDVRAILETGTLARDDDDPLDLQEIEEEEERFWREEEWDEAEEW